MDRVMAITIYQQIWNDCNNVMYGGNTKTLLSARLKVIDTLQYVDCLIKPKAATSKFGRDSLSMLGIVVRELDSVSIKSTWIHP